MLTSADLARARAAQRATMRTMVEICAHTVSRDRFGVETATTTVAATTPARIGMPGGMGSGSMRHLVEQLRDQGTLRTHTRILSLPAGTAITTQHRIRHAGLLWEVVGIADDHTDATAVRAVITREDLSVLQLHRPALALAGGGTLRLQTGGRLLLTTGTP